LSNTAPRGPSSQSWLPLIAVAIGVTVTAVAYGSWWLGDTLAGVNQTLPGNPVEAFIRLGKGQLVWPMTATVIAAAATVLVVATALTVLLRVGGGRGSDQPARAMARPGTLTEITGRSAKAKAERLRPGMVVTKPSDYGIRVGVSVQGGHPLYLSWEDVGTVLAGTRMGKTAAVAIPAVCDAPGPVVATSNKADLHHHTRGVRDTHGRVWLSDLQGIAGSTGQQWWWNPLRGVTTIAPARLLAGYFVDASTTAGSVGNDYFDGGSQELLALHLLAAASAGGDLLHTLEWLSDDNTPVPAQILDAHHHPVPAMAMRRARGINPRQRDGLFDMARRYLSVLGEPSYALSVTPPRRCPLDADGELGAKVVVHDLPEFDPTAFVASNDTVFALSKEGRASSSALTTALVGRIFDAAEDLARRSPAGRLPTPLVAVLDEAANICKLTELPDQYSHFGSQGITVLTVLQSPAQARKVWSENQFEALRSASNIEYYGGGISDTGYLESVSRRIGDHDVQRWSTSVGRGGDRTRSQSWSREPIMALDQLAALPKDRALVMTSGNPPVLVRKTFWQDGPHAAGIRASLARYDTTPTRKTPPRATTATATAPRGTSSTEPA
jgi:type IV secretory pathway TraG/TraD family ATPase VirD4